MVVLEKYSINSKVAFGSFGKFKYEIDRAFHLEKFEILNPEKKFRLILLVINITEYAKIPHIQYFGYLSNIAT